jgi:hypothetical protein
MHTSVIVGGPKMNFNWASVSTNPRVLQCSSMWDENLAALALVASA